MKTELVHYFNWPAEKIIEILKAGEDLFSMEDLPNVSSRKEIEKRRTGSKLYRKYEWCVHGQIPPIAQKFIKPEMLTFVEDTVWDDNTSTFDVKVIPHFLKNSLTCYTKSKWGAANNIRTKRIVECAITVKIPIIGPILEKTILDYFKKNNDKSADAIIKGLTKRLGSPPKNQ